LALLKINLGKLFFPSNIAASRIIRFNTFVGKLGATLIIWRQDIYNKLLTYNKNSIFSDIPFLKKLKHKLGIYTNEKVQIRMGTPEPMFASVRKGLIKINNNSNVNYRLKTGDNYYMYLPNTDELLYLQCSGVAIRAADMKILQHSKNGKAVTYDINCTFGYQFEQYDAVNFSSFKYRENCELYAEENIYEPRQQIETLFLKDC
jgi:hypothetical protein